MSEFYVYILFRTNGIPCYVGKGKGDRWTRHEGRAKHINKHLGSIIDQARRDDVELPRIKVRENMVEAEAFALERLLIGLIGRGDDGPLVNLTDGGDGPSGYKPSPELIERQAATRRGKKQSVESNAKRSASLKNRPKSAEHRAALSEAAKGKKMSSGWWSTAEGRAKQKANNPSPFKVGHKHSAETIEKIRLAAIRQHVRSTSTQEKPT